MKKYISHVLKDWSKKIPESKRGLLLIDNFKGHIDADIENLLKDIRIDVKKLPANSTPYLQPMDISVNAIVKRFYEEFWDDYQSNSTDLTKKGNFKAPSRGKKVIWISKSWAKVTEDTVKNGFNIYYKKLK